MKITKETIHLIEKALNIKLYPWQKEWLINRTPFPDICPCLLFSYKESVVKSCISHFDGKKCRARNRSTGKTTVHCIYLALSDNSEPIDIGFMERYSDWGDGSRRYANGFYKRMFLDIWHSLKDAGLPVRDLRS